MVDVRLEEKQGMVVLGFKWRERERREREPSQMSTA